MDIDTAMAAVEERDGVLEGPFKAPANLASGLGEGSIHDDSTAQKLGFRGGTVAGSVHMQQFPGTLVRAFGPSWFETGNISTYFRFATMHGERVRPFARVLEGGLRADLSMERDDGTLVLEGSASAGGDSEPSYIARKLEVLPERGETRILAHLQPGLVTDEVPAAAIDPVRYERQLEAMTERLDWYDGPTPWGGPVVNPGVAVGLFRSVERGFNLRRDGVVGLFGAIEVAHLAGPIFRDASYTATGELLSVGSTPKSEYIWYKSTLHQSGKDIAHMIMMLRFMKASSPLWKE